MFTAQTTDTVTVRELTPTISGVTLWHFRFVITQLSRLCDVYLINVFIIIFRFCLGANTDVLKMEK